MSDPTDGFSWDDVKSAALDLPGVYMGTCSDSFWGGTVEACDDQLKRVEALRQRYANYPSKRMRRAVMEWADYYERDAKEKREDCRTRKRRLDHEAWRAKDEERQKRRQALRARLP